MDKFLLPFDHHRIAVGPTSAISNFGIDCVGALDAAGFTNRTIRTWNAYKDGDIYGDAMIWHIIGTLSRTALGFA